MKTHNVKSFIWMIFGLIFIGYYLVESIFVGFGFSLLWIWAAGGLVFLLFSYLTHKYKKIPIPKWLFVLALTIILIVGLLFCFLESLVISQMSAKGENGLDYIIVLGANVKKDKSPSKPLLWRIDAAESYLLNNPLAKAVLSGGKGHNEPISEAECMYTELLKRGIDPSRLILESESKSTNENIRFSLDIIGTDAEFGIVTNNFHVFRAVKIAENVTGRTVCGIASKYKDALLIHYMARESIGIIKDSLLGNMKIY